MDHTWIEILAIALGPGGAVYIGLKTALNGMREDVKDIKQTVNKIRDMTMVHVSRDGGR